MGVIPTEFCYGYLRCPPRLEDDVFVIALHDRTPRGRLNEGGAIYLAANGIPVATVRPAATLSQPQLAKAGDVTASAAIEFRYSDVKRILTEHGAWEEPGIIRLECVDPARRRVADSALFALPVGMGDPVPSDDNIIRVAGKQPGFDFRVSGACWYTMIQDVVAAETGAALKKDARLLDWGVGCARIARYFIETGFPNLSGIDIDQYNVDWCLSNLPGADFRRCDFDPPTEYEDASFDLIYGHSVLTHLTRQSEAEWLSELDRLLAPSGLACLTFISDVGMYLNHNVKLKADPSLYAELWHTGRIDFGAMRVGVDKDRPGYYRIVAHSYEYVLREWSKIFDIVRIIPGFANNQDAVLLRKKSFVSRIDRFGS